ncbi:thiol:disulfide interchange protein DsbA/DsbL [Thalassotalea mangrovi]|uniref:Thiol:disulfide interchange protein n=1 Tax=Thalassotalea mangrovi TaxID=2572245 RepID=A0A4U1B3L1_9GAMM|nr:thiol:disulfide interchange protein DsbA/DsbL [Thalassotalea mangrovi]TKB44428.1 thiol:disulfide interchange protein DsbA/DsbL [Thalassotalea mangrovi]
MKKLISLVLLVALTACNGQEAKYVEGKHYTKVSETASAKPEVREYFSFYCPHCLRYEPLMQDLARSLPEGVTFEKNHVDFLRAASPEIQFDITKALAVAKQLPQKERLIAAIFKEIQGQGRPITSPDDLRRIFVTNGVDGELFDKKFKSDAVNAEAKKQKKNQDDLVAKRALTGVPTVVVNGKYRVNPSELDQSDFVNDYKKLVIHLSQMD